MSAICLVNLKINSLNFDEFNDLAKKLVRYCLARENLAVFFNSFDYGKTLIVDEHMKNFFLLSDSFLYKNCEFLEEVPFIDPFNLVESEKVFTEKNNFFNDVFNIVFSYNVSEITVFLSIDGSVERSDEFIPLSATPENFLHIFFNSVISNAEKCAYQIPSLKFTIHSTHAPEL